MNKTKIKVFNKEELMNCEFNEKTIKAMEKALFLKEKEIIKIIDKRIDGYENLLCDEFVKSDEDAKIKNAILGELLKIKQKIQTLGETK
jgi:hypothetical protein